MNPDTSDIEINEGTSDAQQATTNSLPESSRDLYEAMYKTFSEWRNEKELEISEDVLVTYFTELAKKYKPSSLWHKYSLLKATIKINHNIDIANYKQILAFLREQAKGYEPKPTKVLSEDNIKEFLDKAPDHVYLATKVSMIIGILGELRIEDLVKIEMKDVEDCGKLFVIRIPKTKSRPEKSITIQDDYYKKVKHYISLRPSKINHQRFFLNYQKGKCTVQPIGKNKFSAMPKQIAKFLDLPEADSYTGHSLRRSSKTFFANAEANITTIRRHGKWKSSIIIDSYVGDSLTSKTKIASLITSSINFEKSNIEPKSDEKIDSSSMDDSKIDADTRKLCSQLCVPVYEDEVQENETMCLELRTESTDFDTSITDNVISNQFQLPKNFNFNNCTVNINISK